MRAKSDRGHVVSKMWNGISGEMTDLVLTEAHQSDYPGTTVQLHAHLSIKSAEECEKRIRYILEFV